MAHLPNGYNVTNDDWDALDDRISALEAAVLNTGATVGDATLDANVGHAEVTDTLSATGSVTVTHGLGWTPTTIEIQMRGNPSLSGPYTTYVSTKTDTSFIVFFGWKSSDGTGWDPGAEGQSVTFDWTARK